MSRRWRKPKQARSLERVERILDVADALFVEGGYAAATTKEIAAQAEVPIGSLYQFFPDKAAILDALAARYTDLLNQRLQALGTPEMARFSLSDYVEQLTEGVEQFFVEYPGYRAIFMEITATMPEVDEATDAQLIETIAAILPKSDAALDEEDRKMIAFVLVKAMGNLLWRSLGQAPQFRQRLVLETQRLAFHYLKSYFPETLSGNGE
ncbi:TetR/AcrR family transcriptional regulator [Vacuolonema iberomarrocanum]|uniref:TetR/AcrR family transcriptional regulator n=1 Tax=Vacuolonema iberomarrocanum TaxID=3454632 RepID=UPI003F6E034D